MAYILFFSKGLMQWVLQVIKHIHDFFLSISSIFNIWLYTKIVCILCDWCVTFCSFQVSWMEPDDIDSKSIWCEYSRWHKIEFLAFKHLFSFLTIYIYQIISFMHWIFKSKRKCDIFSCVKICVFYVNYTISIPCTRHVCRIWGGCFSSYSVFPPIC